MGLQFKSAFSPPSRLKFKPVHLSPKEKRAWHHQENQSFSPGAGEGFCGVFWVVQHCATLFLTYPIPSPGVTQRAIKMAGCDSTNIATFSHFNLIWPLGFSRTLLLGLPASEVFLAAAAQHPFPSPSSASFPALGLSLHCKKERHLSLHSREVIIM